MASPSITSNTNSDTSNCNSCVTVLPQLGGGKTSQTSTSSTVNSSTTTSSSPSSSSSQQQQSHQQALTASSSDLTNVTIVSPVPPGVQTGVPHRSTGIEFNFQQQLFQLKQQQQLQQQLLLQQFQQQQARLAEQHEKQLHERIRVSCKWKRESKIIDLVEVQSIFSTLCVLRCSFQMGNLLFDFPFAV